MAKMAVAPKTLEPRFLRHGKPNKSEMMREALSKLGPTVPNKDITAYVKSMFGVDLLQSDMVNLSGIRGKITGGRKGKAAKVASTTNGHVKSTATTFTKGVKSSLSSSTASGPISTLKTVKAAVEACGGKSQLIQYVEEMDW